jgi:hypothetical protein
MTVTAFGGPGEPDSSRSDTELEGRASAAVSVWMHDHEAVTAELEEAVRSHTHLLELEGRARQAATVAAAAQQRAASLTSKLDPDGHRILGFGAGAVIVTALTVLDAVPLNWAAQAFGLDSAGTWLITSILLVASVGAMAGLELTRGYARRRAALAAVIAVAYVALVVLRTEFLTTVSGASPVAALLQAVLLSAISAGLVLCGSAVMARTRSLGLDRARAVARRTRQAAAAAQAAAHRAAEKMQRHLGVLRQMLIPWALGSAAPAGVGHASWTAALERAIRTLFPGL